MPVTLQPTTLKYKDGQTFVSADCLKGDPGSPGDPTQLIDDTAGSGDTDKVWSANKTNSEVNGVKNRVGALEPAASASDVGKALIVKTVADGKATSYEYGTAGGGGHDIPTGGTQGQILAKHSATDYDVEWATPADPTSVIDDNAGPFTTDKTFSASKLWSDLGGKVDKTGAQFNDVSMGRVPNSTVGNQSIAIGTSDNPNQGAIASGDNSVAVGTYVQATGNRAIAIGSTTQATGINATAIGGSVTASGDFSFSHGSSTSAQGINSTAEGYGTTASGMCSSAGGSQTFAIGDYSHSQGYSTRAEGYASSVEGNGTVAKGANSSVSGMYNVPDSYANWPDWAPNTYYAAGAKVHLPVEEPSDPRGEYFVCNTSHTSDTAWITYSFYWDSDNGKMNYAQIVGNGSNYLQQSNAYTLDWAGNGSYAGDVTINKGTAEEISVSELKSQITSKMDEPSTEGTSGQVLTTDGNGGRTWTTPQGGGGSVDPSKIAEAVADWCEENITEDPTVVIDKSLLVEGAAADAKATGVIRSTFNDLVNKEEVTIHVDWEQGGIGSGASESAVTTRIRTKYINVEGYEKIVVDVSNGSYDATVFWFTSASQAGYISETVSWVAADGLVLTPPSTAKYLRICVRNHNNTSANVSPTEGAYFTFLNPNSQLMNHLQRFDEFEERARNALAFNAIINLFDKSTVTVGKRIKQNGDIEDNNTLDLTDYIPVKPNTKYKRNNSAYINFYTDNKVYISTGDISQSSAVTTPSGCYYVRTYMLKTGGSSTNENIDNFMWVDGETLPSAYVPYDSEVLLKKFQGRANAGKVMSVDNDGYIVPMLMQQNVNAFGRYVGKTIAFLGDSFTARADETGYYSYVNEVIAILGASKLNYGVASTGYCSSSGSFADRVANMSADADAVIVFGGINDFGARANTGDKEIGSPTDAVSSSSFCGRVKKCFENLLTKYPAKKIGVLVPCRIASSAKAAEAGLTYGRDTNGLGNTLKDYVDALKECAEIYALPVLDLFNKCGWSDFNITTMTDDGLHPNQTGCAWLGNVISDFISSL